MKKETKIIKEDMKACGGEIIGGGGKVLSGNDRRSTNPTYVR